MSNSELEAGARNLQSVISTAAARIQLLLALLLYCQLKPASCRVIDHVTSRAPRDVCEISLTSLTYCYSVDELLMGVYLTNQLCLYNCIFGLCLAALKYGCWLSLGVWNWMQLIIGGWEASRGETESQTKK